jgi:uncharacterized protein YutE (UPF0331/DUF86 family)
MEDKEIIQNRLSLLLGYLEELGEFIDIKYDDYLQSNKNRRTVERLIELIVECGSDISGNILSNYNAIPESYYQSFSFLGEKGILDKQFSKELAKFGGLRNRIIHEYGSYKDEIVFSQIKPCFSSFKRFYQEIINYLKTEK